MRAARQSTCLFHFQCFVPRMHFRMHTNAQDNCEQFFKRCTTNRRQIRQGGVFWYNFCCSLLFVLLSSRHGNFHLRLATSGEGHPMTPSCAARQWQCSWKSRTRGWHLARAHFQLRHCTQNCILWILIVCWAHVRLHLMSFLEQGGNRIFCNSSGEDHDFQGSKASIV